MTDLLEEMYPLAVEAGISAKTYWELTYDELVVQLQALNAQKEADYKREANLDYTLANLISYAFHEPNKIPKFEEIYVDESKPKIDIEEQKFMQYFNRINQTMAQRKGVEHGN